MESESWDARLIQYGGFIIGRLRSSVGLIWVGKVILPGVDLCRPAFLLILQSMIPRSDSL